MASSEEINWTPSATIQKCLRDLIGTRFPNENHEYTIEKATQKGDNYLGIIYRIKLISDRRAKKPVSLILKVPPQNLIRRKQFFARPCFLREALTYDEFLPMVMQFQNNKGIRLNDGFHAFAECYSAITTELDEAIIMEDLHLRGFELFNRFDEITVDYVRIVMRIYGQLHALSFAFKDQCAENFRKFQQLEDIFEERRQDGQLCAYFEQLKKSTLSSLHAEQDAKYMRKLQNFFAKGTVFDMLLELIVGRNNEPYAVVCHGDCWNNNILFQHEENKVVDACLIDWQIMRYASPITDLMYYLFTCTTKAFREKHFHEMLDIYYKELTEHIKKLGSNPQTLFPKNVFHDEVQKFGAIGLLMAMIVLPITTMQSEDVPNLEELSERINAGATTDLEGTGLLGLSNINAYSKRMRDTVIDCIDLGYI